ncbi:MAG: type III PLP-dependent enzyme [bacterium]|nr:type III PLP-dependent enzyme [bacterium]
MSDLFSKETLEKYSANTPFFLFSINEIKKNYYEFQENFPDANIFYAMKANSEYEVLKTLNELGSGFEVASVYELRMLKDLGVSPDKIIYGTSIKPSASIKEFYEYGVRVFASDSPSEIEKIAEVAPGSKVYIRERVNDTDSVFKFSEKFGTDHSGIVSLLSKARDLGLIPYGISFHVGSQSSNPMAWAHALLNLQDVLEQLRINNINIEIINLGGGFPCTYASSEKDISLKEISINTFDAYSKLKYKPKLILEPGRGMIACSGILVTTIIARIERNGYQWLFLDAGVYNALFESMAYQGSTRYKVSALKESSEIIEEILFSLAGPTGDGPDVITREALLPQDLEVGDKLAIHNVGAYSIVVTSRFNGFPRPEVHFI